MIQQSIHQCCVQTLFLVMLSSGISSLQNFQDSKLHRSASVEGNYLPNRRNLLPAREEIQVEQIKNQQGEEAGDVNHETMLDVNQTLSPTIVLQKENTVCYDDLGCITRFILADPFLWPINLLPEKREKIGTHFTLYTRENPNPQPPIQISASNLDQLSATTFKATRRTKFLIHGWNAAGHGDIGQSLTEALLANGDFNVITVNWEGGASAFYFQASANTRLVGLEVSRLVNTMVEKLGVNAADVHLIGHSLGAHAAGYAGEKIPNLGRITGLDPAGPYFWKMPSYARLDNTDAQFVDVVHTNAGFIGISEPIGHIDFYPNGGQRQPGCFPSHGINMWDFSAILSYLNGCDHIRATTLYSASLLGACRLVAYECSDYDSFNRGKCTSCGEDNTKCAPFGLDADNYPSRSRLNAKFYFNTGGDSPFCLSQYLVAISLGKPPGAQATIRGSLQLSVAGENAFRISTLPTTVFEHGKDNRFLLSAPSSLGPIRKVYLDWRHTTSGFSDPTCFLGICNKRLYVNNITVSLLNSYPESNRIANTYTSCPVAVPAIVSSFFSVELSGVNGCSSTSASQHSTWSPDPWIIIYKR